MDKVKIERSMNGWVVTGGNGSVYVCMSVEEMLIRVKQMLGITNAVEAGFDLGRLGKAAK
jgi:hypothetical protein